MRILEYRTHADKDLNLERQKHATHFVKSFKYLVTAFKNKHTTGLIT